MIRTKDWVFLHIPKTSGINFIRNAEVKVKELQNCHKKYHKHFTHQPLWWWEEINLINQFDYIFAIVRNPYERFVSLYNHIASNRKVLPFDEFIKTDQLCEIDKIIEHEVGILEPLLQWKLNWPQHKFIESKQNNKVNVYKIETQLPDLEKYVNFTFTNTFYNKRNHMHWASYYSKYTFDAIYTLYKEDFKLFDYNRM